MSRDMTSIILNSREVRGILDGSITMLVRMIKIGNQTHIT